MSLAEVIHSYKQYIYISERGFILMQEGTVKWVNIRFIIS